MPNKDPTVFIVEDDEAIASGLSWIFNSVKLNVEVFSNGIEYLNAFDPNRSGCLIIDIRLPVMNGLELQEKLSERGSHTPVIIITAHGDVPLAVRAMKAGAKDFILKPFQNEYVLEQVQRIILNSTDEQINRKQFNKKLATLTAREQEVLHLVVEGHSSKAIAYELGISVSTVEQHRTHIMRKMDVKSFTGLIKSYTLKKF